ncbi:jg1800 [Pararge aegeria aegeria]|uniref:Jg1800 protein n=1 Tax=Pararge aegeria aegeria TaxID=348720 RepID=A0A8S4RW64_9NEOP|nr:jg1800 [Pararge aegeria aegeria]
MATVCVARAAPPGRITVYPTPAQSVCERQYWTCAVYVLVALEFVIPTEKEKVSKYWDLAHEITAMWNVESTVVVPIVVSVNGLLAKSFDQHLKKLSLGCWIKGRIQKAVVLETARIIVAGRRDTRDQTKLSRKQKKKKAECSLSVTLPIRVGFGGSPPSRNWTFLTGTDGRWGPKYLYGGPALVSAALVDPQRGGQTTLSLTRGAAGPKRQKTVEF